jgi:hypothetical protein
MKSGFVAYEVTFPSLFERGWELTCGGSELATAGHRLV